MTPEQREKFYDAEIAPALAALGTRCHENGMSFVALVDWSPDNVAVTAQLAERASPQARWSRFAALCRANVDNLIVALVREASASGHSSICLRALGVPDAPGRAAKSV